MSRPAYERLTLELYSVQELWRCSAIVGRGKRTRPCDFFATCHVADAGDAPYCSDHAVRLFSAWVARAMLAAVPDSGALLAEAVA